MQEPPDITSGGRYRGTEGTRNQKIGSNFQQPLYMRQRHKKLSLSQAKEHFQLLQDKDLDIISKLTNNDQSHFRLLVSGQNNKMMQFPVQKREKVFTDRKQTYSPNMNRYSR